MGNTTAHLIHLPHNIRSHRTTHKAAERNPRTVKTLQHQPLQDFRRQDVDVEGVDVTASNFTPGCITSHLIFASFCVQYKQFKHMGVCFLHIHNTNVHSSSVLGERLENPADERNFMS